MRDPGIHRTHFEQDVLQVLKCPDGALRLPYLFGLRISPQKARYLTLTSKKVSAREALGLGMIDEIYADSDFERGVKGVVKRLFRSSPEALAQAKSFTRQLIGPRFEEMRVMAREKFLELTGRSDVMEAVEAFNEGDVPRWFGRYRPEKPLTFKRDEVSNG